MRFAMEEEYGFIKTKNTRRKFDDEPRRDVKRDKNNKKNRDYTKERERKRGEFYTGE